MIARVREPGTTPLWKGALAGLVAGAVGTIVMTQAQRLLAQALSSSKVSDSEDEGGDDASKPATAKAAERIAERAWGSHLSQEREEQASQVVHYGFGTAVGATYGAIAERFPAVTVGAGVPFGAALMLAADEVAVPALGLSKPPTRQPLSTHAYSLAAHLVYGLSAEATRRLVRRWL